MACNDACLAHRDTSSVFLLSHSSNLYWVMSLAGDKDTYSRALTSNMPAAQFSNNIHGTSLSICKKHMGRCLYLHCVDGETETKEVSEAWQKSHSGMCM